MAIIKNQEEALERIYNQGFSDLYERQEFLNKIGKVFDDTESQLKGLNHEEQLEHLKKSLPNRILKVQSRLALINELREKIRNADNIGQVYAFPGLITYLILTCFDQLGQAKLGWYFFPDWLISKKTKDEVDDVISNLESLENYSEMTEAQKARFMYLEYHKDYGVKNAFYNFIQNILSRSAYRKLLDNILIEKYEKGVWQSDRPNSIDDNEKIRWLFNTRNNYTHNLHTVESNITPGKRERGATWMRRDVLEKGDSATVIWVTEEFNDILIECLNLGIAELINK